MSYKINESTVHNYSPVNEYIDEKARFRRTKSTWRNVKSLTLFLLALGIFLILAAYAYHIFKKPHPSYPIRTNNTQNERIVNDLIEKDTKIKNLKNELSSDKDNQQLKDRIEQLEKEKKEMEDELKKENEKIVDGKNVIYNETASKFLKYPTDPKAGDIVVTTGLSWETVESMMYGEPHKSSWCYIERSGEKGASYWFDETNKNQSGVLNILGLTESEAKSYQKYCQID